MALIATFSFNLRKKRPHARWCKTCLQCGAAVSESSPAENRPTNMRTTAQCKSLSEGAAVFDDTIAHVGSPAEQRVNSYPSGPSGVITQRLRYLDSKLGKGNILQLSISAGVAAGVAGILKRRPIMAAVTAMVLGVCAGARLYRNLPRSVQHRVDRERLALRAVRGDFDGIHDEWSRRARAMQLLRE